MRFPLPLLAALPLLIAAAPVYQRWGEVDFGGRRGVYLEDDSERPGLVTIALCTTSSSVVELRHYRPQAAPARIAQLDRLFGAGRPITNCDRACQLATQAIARRNAVPEAELQPQAGLAWTLTKADAVAHLRSRLAELGRPRPLDNGSARREQARATDIVTRFERQCGSIY